MQNDKAKVKNEFKDRTCRFVLSGEGMEYLYILNCNFDFLSLNFDIFCRRQK